MSCVENLQPSGGKLQHPARNLLNQQINRVVFRGLCALDRTCLKTWQSSEDCTRGEDGRETAKKKPRRKMLDLLMEQEDNKFSYEELKRGLRGAQSRPVS